MEWNDLPGDPIEVNSVTGCKWAWTDSSANIANTIVHPNGWIHVLQVKLCIDVDLFKIMHHTTKLILQFFKRSKAPYHSLKLQLYSMMSKLSGRSNIFVKLVAQQILCHKLQFLMFVARITTFMHNKFSYCKK